jgi:prevent-host-death family protein
MVRTISAPDAQANFGDLLDTVRGTHEAEVVEQNGEAVAVVISPEEFARFRQSEEDGWWTSIQRVKERNADRDPDEVFREVTDLVEEVRRDRRARQTADDHRS